MSKTRLNSRALIRLSATDAGQGDSEDVREFLQALVTQDTKKIQPDQPQWGALLSAQGKVLFDFFLWASDDDILIDCEADQAEALAKRLKLYRLRRKIDINLDNNLAVHWALESQAQPADPRLAALGHRWLEQASKKDSCDNEYKAHRLSLGVTEGQDELGSDKTLWLECNAAELNGVSFTKGCYVGQENTARMNYRQKVNRRLVVVPLDQANEKRQRFVYPDLGLSVEHRKIDDLDGLTLPDWLSSAIAGETA